jgi:hypothetical protein
MPTGDFTATFDELGFPVHTDPYTGARGTITKGKSGGTKMEANIGSTQPSRYNFDIDWNALGNLGQQQQQPWQPGPFDLTQPGMGENMARFATMLMGSPPTSQQQWGQAQNFFNQPMWGTEFAKGQIPGMTEAGIGQQTVSDINTRMQAPGAGQNYWNQVQGQLGGPMGGETYMAGQLPGVTQAGLGQQFAGQMVPGMQDRATSNLATEAYDRLQGQMPDLQGGPGLDPYYENAKRGAQEDIRAQTAALGAYGSAAGQEMGAEAMTNLAAEQANREADYRLRQLQEQRMWEGLGGQMAGQASAEQRGWMTGLGGLAQGAEALDVQRQGLGADIAQAMQGLGLDRMGLGGELAGQAGREDVLRQGLRGELGLGAERLGLDKILGALSGARGVDTTNLAQAMGGMEAAGGVDRTVLDKLFGTGDLAMRGQAAGEGRIGDMFTRTTGMGNILSALAGGAYGGMQGGEMDLMTTINNLLLGGTGAGYGVGERERQYGIQGANNLFNLLGMLGAFPEGDK